MKKFYLLYILILIPIVNYNLLAVLALFLILFVVKFNRLVLFNFFIFLFFGLVLFLTNNNITIFKYLISITALLFLFNYKKDISINFFNITTILLVFYAAIESSGFRDSLRYFYRSSNIDLHYGRYSCFFLFPGDLGAFCAIAISLHLLMLVNNPKSSNKLTNYFFIFLNFILILLSQSRMALFHLAISMSLFILAKPKYLYVLFPILPILFLLKDNFSYLFHEDIFYLLGTFFSSDDSGGNKRAQEIFEIINSTEGDLGYYEGSLPSFLSRFGLTISTLIFSSITISFFFFWNKIGKKFLSLIVILPLFITSIISAPLERPKLLFFSFASILLTRDILNKSIKLYN